MAVNFKVSDSGSARFERASSDGERRVEKRVEPNFIVFESEKVKDRKVENPSNAVSSALGFDRVQAIKAQLSIAYSETRKLGENAYKINKIALENGLDPQISQGAAAAGDNSAAFKELNQTINRYYNEKIADVRRDPDLSPNQKRMIVRELEDERGFALTQTKQKFTDAYNKNYAEIARSSGASPDTIERMATSRTVNEWNERVASEAEAAYVYLGESKVVGPDLTADDIRNIVARAEKAQGVDLPLNDGKIPELIVYESKRTGVPVWLALAQAGKETIYGCFSDSQPNYTVADNQLFTDGSRGNAHNLYGVRTSPDWEGKAIHVNNRDFRVYDSFEDSIRDYFKTVTQDRYRGTTLKVFVEGDGKGKGGYAPIKDQNAGYLKNILAIVRSYGIEVSDNSVPIPN